MENLNFDHALKWKYTKLGAELLGRAGEEYITRIPYEIQLNRELAEELMNNEYLLSAENIIKHLNPHLKIIHKPDGVYDVYDTDLDKWLFSRSSADNVFAELSQYGFVNIEFIDEVYP